METGNYHSPSSAAEESHQYHMSSSPSLYQYKKNKPKGGWRAIKYILGNESFEKLASMSLGGNLTVYLRTRYNLDGIFLVNVVQIWNGTTNFSTIPGAIISDAFVGRFRTLLFGTILALLGMGAMTLTAGIPQLRPPACHEPQHCTPPQKWQLAFLFTSLGLLSIGAGGIRPCNIAFGADQFDTKTEKGRSQLGTFFNWWYFSFTIALIIALTVVVYIQTDISWLIGYAIPTACLLISVTIFLFGRHTYIYKKPCGSVFLDMPRVATAAFRKRKMKLNGDDSVCYYDLGVNHDVESSDEADKLFKVNNKFKYLDKAAVISGPGELDPHGLPINKWRLCSLQQVENFKCLLGIFPVWISGISCFVVMDQQSTFGIMQAMQMNKQIGKHFTIPPGWLGISSMIALSIWIVLYEILYMPTAKKYLKRDSRLTMQQRIMIGIIMSIICMLVAGLVEMKRKAMALNKGTYESPLHVAALLPQFMLSGLTEAFAAISLMEFYTLQLPESMRSVAGAIFFVSLSISSYLSSLLVNVIHLITRGKGESGWIGGRDLNRNKLENYYFIIAILGAVNLMYFAFFARKYVFNIAKLEAVKEGGDARVHNNSEASTSKSAADLSS